MNKPITTIKTFKQMAFVDTRRKFVHMYMHADENGDPIMRFVTKKAIYLFPLTQGFEVHLCNEFLRSLDVINNIEFITYAQYSCLIITCGLFLEEKQKNIIKRFFSHNG